MKDVEKNLEKLEEKLIGSRVFLRGGETHLLVRPRVRTLLLQFHVKPLQRYVE